MLRSERSKAAIADALMQLLAEGESEPTAEQVAERADVGIRTVFRHFKDMETLYTAIDERLEARHAPTYYAPVPEGSLATRARECVARRASLFDRLAPFKRAANIKRPRSEALQRLHESLVRRLDKDLRRWFPELASMRPEVEQSLRMTLSFEAWDRLRVEQRLGKKRAAATMEYAAKALLQA